MELTKKDSQMAQGIAILGMIVLRLFCREGNLPYEPLIWLGSRPLIYYIGLLGEICVPIYLFCSGYAQYLLHECEGKDYIAKSWIRILKLLLNFWMVLLLAVVFGSIFDETKSIPGTFGAFLGNFFLYRFSYNGIWWFMSTYVQLIVLAPIMIRVVRRLPLIATILLSGLLYLLSIVYDRAVMGQCDVEIVSWLERQFQLLCKSQFSFVVGMACYRYKIISKLRNLKYKDVLFSAIAAVTVVAACVIETAVIAPIVGIAILICFHVCKKPKFIRSIFAFLGTVSTNVWLLHAFFYARIFPDFVFVAKYPVAILLLMFALCIPISCLINFAHRALCDLLLGKIYKKQPT